MSDINTKVKQVIADQLGHKPEDVSESSRLIEDLGGDSLDTVEIVMELEAEFGIEIPNDDMENVVTVADVIAAVQRITAN